MGVNQSTLSQTLGQYTKSSDLTTALGSYTKSSDLTTTLGGYAKTADVNTLLQSYITSDAFSTGLAAYANRAEVQLMLTKYPDNDKVAALLSSYLTSTDFAARSLDCKSGICKNPTALGIGIPGDWSLVGIDGKACIKFKDNTLGCIFSDGTTSLGFSIIPGYTRSTAYGGAFMQSVSKSNAVYYPIQEVYDTNQLETTVLGAPGGPFLRLGSKTKRVDVAGDLFLTGKLYDSTGTAYPSAAQLNALIK